MSDWGSGERYTSHDLMSSQLDPVHTASSNIVLLSLVPAIQVAWADGTIQSEERTTILSLAERHGLASDPIAMARIRQWLEIAPTDEEVQESVREVKTLAAEVPELGGAGRVLEWAREVARAEGGVFGIGAVSPEERRALERIEASLRDAATVASRSAGPGALQLMRDLLRERLDADTTHVDLTPTGEVPPLPVKSPMDPDRLPPAVFAVPERDYREYMAKIIPRYVQSIRDGWWDAVRFAVSAHGVAPMDDHELGRLVAETPFSRFLVPTLDPVDETLFADVLAQARARGRPIYKLDQSHYGTWSPLPGLRIAPTVALFAAKGDRLKPLAISVRGRVFRPSDGESWARARYFVLQGCSTSLVVGIHPFLHFPMDSVIAVTREVLPPEHPIARLIEVHAYLQLPLNYGVSWNPRSAAHNHQTEVYTAFAARRDDIFRGIGDFYSGLPGNSGYPGFRYPMAAPAFFGPYCRFLARYYDVVLEHCRRVASARPVDERILRWGAILHGLLPGFPAADALNDPETLARALAGFVHSVSIWHSTEHYVYSLEPVTRVPNRLRIEEPVGDDPPTSPSTWMRPVDIARQELTRRMFYQAHTLRSILEIDYRFEDPSLATAQADFLAALRACDRDQPRSYVELENIACSLQF